MCIITDATCDLPFYYDDEYEIAGRDLLHMNSSMIVDYPLSIPGTSRRNFGCIEKQGDIYLLKGTEEVNIFGQLTTLYMCLEIRQVNNATYYYYYKTGYHQFLQDYLFGSKIGEPSFVEVCSETTDEKAFIMISKKDSYDEGLLNTTCPQDILAVFDNVNITSSSGTKTTGCPGTTVDACTDRTTVAFTYNSTCAVAKMTSAGGMYSCLFSKTLGSDTYLGVWNQDTTVDGSNTFRFSCFVYSIIGDVLYATETPTACTSTTTSTNLGSATEGVTIVAWNIISSRHLSNSSESDLPDVFKPKQSVQDLTMISAIFKERKIPVIMLTPKVGPMYSDTLDDYLRSGRSYSQTSLFRLDSGVFDEDLDME
ncbi:unnamed protein product [Mytilus edulis]|uniref:DUF7042 domain-containing protein n=1 Tax=Mytilus edulis TaxID=6550 RepID=A0A8S3SQJ2_MYTED|nr:unnamed protein product [Mytilus edulis]